MERKFGKNYLAQTQLFTCKSAYPMSNTLGKQLQERKRSREESEGGEE